MRGLGYVSVPKTKEAPGILWGKCFFSNCSFPSRRNGRPTGQPIGFFPFASLSISGGLGFGVYGIGGDISGSEKKMETTIMGAILGSYWGDMGEVGKKMETTGIVLGQWKPYTPI